MDTTVRFVSNFLFTQLGCTPSDPEPLPNTFNLNTTVSEIERSFEIYPNPVSTELCIALKNNVSKIDKIRINDISGKELLLLNISEPKTKIDLSSLSSGTYFVSIQTKDKTEVRKFIKN
jgi:hypothetical protein